MLKNYRVFAGLLDWEPVAGYPLRSFDWILALYILGIAALVGVLGYFLYVFVFTKAKMTREEEKQTELKMKEIKMLKGKEKKAAIKELSGPQQRLRVWKIINVPIYVFLTFGLTVSCVAAPILSTTYEALMQAIRKQTGGGNNDSDAAKLAIGEAKENVVTLANEGIVLLKNDNDVLPLNVNNNNKINIFGSSAFGMLYGGGGSGVFVTNHYSNGNDFRATRLEAALKDEGFDYNMNLYNLVANYYESKSYKLTSTDYIISCQNNVYAGNGYDSKGNLILDPTKFPYDNEPEVSAYTRTYDGLDGKTLLDAAKEYSDTAIYAVSRAGSEDGDFAQATLKLTARETAMVEFLKENFEKVIFIINSSNAMELGVLDDPKVDSVLWIGHPGLTGNKAVAKIIAGKSNPSGKMADTWAYDITKNPAYASFGPDTTLYSGQLGKSLVEYREGIYVGYRYYTTRAFTDETFKYDDEVQYSFGQGMSYTTFEKYISDYEINLEENKASIQVSIKNTGTIKGKEVAQLYITAPYTPGGIEKAYVELAGFAKTTELEPGEQYFARIEIDLEMLASWDTPNARYVLEKGEYEISLRDDCWNVTPVEAIHLNSVKFNLTSDKVFTKGKGGATYSAQFADAEYGPHNDPIVYLSRNNWEETFPVTSDIKTNDISAKAAGAVANPTYRTDNTIIGDATINTPADITMRDMKDAKWDDPRWDSFISQLSRSELIDLIDNGGFQTAAIPSIQKRATYDDDGPASIQVKGTGYVSEVVLASSFNVEAARLFGESIGKEGAAMGLTGWYAPGLNMHRLATGGRNFEYYSEDPILAGYMAGYTAKGTAKYGVYTYAKHILLNEQETQRQNLTVWANEQSIRQIYLRGNEIYTQLGGLGFMSSFSRIGSVWSGAHGFLNTVCRDEWGFHGVVITDWINPSLMPEGAGLRGGNDLWLFRNTTSSASDMLARTPNDGILLLKRAAKNILYTCANSNAVWTEEEYHELGVDVDFSKMGYTNFQETKIMKKKLLFPIALVSTLVVVACNRTDTPKEPDYTPITVLSANLDQGHQSNPLFHDKVKREIVSVMPDLFGVQEEGQGWVDYLIPTFEDYGYTHIYQNRGGSFSEASGVFVNLDRFEIKQSGTFWLGPNGGPDKSGYIATEWGAGYPRVCTWVLLHDKYADKDISYFNTHFEYSHAMSDLNLDATPEDNNNIARENSIKQVIEQMQALEVPGIFTGDLNFFRENEPGTYEAALEYFDDAWDKAPNKQEMCSFHNYGQELNPETRKNPYSPIDYIFTTKDEFTTRQFTIMNNEGNKEEDFVSDHFFVYATFGYGLNNYGDNPINTNSSSRPTSSSGVLSSTSNSDITTSSSALSSSSPTSSSTTSSVPVANENAVKIMSANLDQGHQNNPYYHSKVLAQFDAVDADLIGVQEEGSGWQSALTSAMSTRGYTRIGESRGGSYPEASGIYIKNSRFTIKQSGTFWFGPNGGENKSGYIATEWGASFPRIATWALLTDNETGQDISFFNAHLEYNHAFGDMNGAATAASNTKYARQASCQQVVDKMEQLGVPGFFVGDLNSYRSLETKVYSTCLAYFDDAWANYPLSEQMCTFHDYGRLLGNPTATNPNEPIDYIYSTKSDFAVTDFTIMHEGMTGTNESTFDSDHFFIHATFNYNY